MQLRLLKYPRPSSGATLPSGGHVTWTSARNPNVATDLDGARLFMAINRMMTIPGNAFNAEDNRYILVYDSLGTTLKQMLALPPRNYMVMQKLPTDRIAISNAHPVIQNAPTIITSNNPGIGGEGSETEMVTVTPLGYSDHPIVYQNSGDWKFTFQNGLLGGFMSTNGACNPSRANSVGGATIVHAANFENNKACIQLVDANNNAVGSMQLPRGAHIKFRKRATDKVYASETISGGGAWDACRVIFEKIGYTN